MCRRERHHPLHSDTPRLATSDIEWISGNRACSVPWNLERIIARSASSRHADRTKFLCRGPSLGPSLGSVFRDGVPMLLDFKLCSLGGWAPGRRRLVQDYPCSSVFAPLRMVPAKIPPGQDDNLDLESLSGEFLSSSVSIRPQPGRCRYFQVWAGFDHLHSTSADSGAVSMNISYSPAGNLAPASARKLRPFPAQSQTILPRGRRWPRGSPPNMLKHDSQQHRPLDRRSAITPKMLEKWSPGYFAVIGEPTSTWSGHLLAKLGPNFL